MRPKTPKLARPGDVLTADMWNEVIGLLKRSSINLGQNTNIEALQGPDGIALNARNQCRRFLAVANGDITVRSGSTAGKGSVFLVTVQATVSGGAITAYTLTTTSISYPVYNPSATAMTSTKGVNSGQYCVIEELPQGSGLFCVSPLECS